MAVEIYVRAMEEENKTVAKNVPKEEIHVDVKFVEEVQKVKDFVASEE